MITYEARVSNLSPQPQLRWCTVAMPLSLADQLPDEVLIDGRHPAVKGRQLGVISQLWHVRVDVAGHHYVDLREWEPPAWFPEHDLSDWLTDDWLKAAIQIQISERGQWKLTLGLETIEEVESTKACKTWRLSSSKDGYHGVVYLTAYSGQDACDVEGYAIWSDDTDPLLRREDVQVAVTTGKWPLNAPGNERGEDLVLYDDVRNGFARWENNWTRVYRGNLPNGVMIPFRGALLPRQDTPLLDRTPITFEEQGDAPLDKYRLQQLDAARGGPLIGAGKWLQGEWLGFGSFPETNDRLAWSDVRDYFATPGKLTRRRRDGHPLQHRLPGAQPPYGCTKGTLALHGDPLALYFLRDSGDDYCLRWFHSREQDGRPVTRDTRPGLVTWWGGVEYRERHFDTFGKAKDQPDRYEWMGDRHCGADDQHRSINVLAASYALTGSWIQRDALLDVVETDRLRRFARTGEHDAPRADGRLAQSWALTAQLFPERLPMIEALLRENLEQVKSHQQKEGPVQPVKVNFRPDLIVEDGTPRPAVMWWHEAILCRGYWMASHVLTQLDSYSELAADLLYFAKRIAEQIWDHGSTIDLSTGQREFLTVYRYQNGSGAPQPPSYYAYPREGAKPHDSSPGWNMEVRGGAWTRWFSGAIALAASYDNPWREEAQQVMERDLARYVHDVEALEWWAY